MPFDPEPDQPDEDDIKDIPDTLSPEQRRKAAKLLADVNRITGRQNASMLGALAKGKTHAEKINGLFTEMKLSPLTELVMLCRIERAKVYLYNRTLEEGGDVSALPPPNMKLYISLLKDLVQYEVPNFKSIEISGKVDVGMRVHLMQYMPEEKIIELDGESPEKLRLAANSAKMATLPGNTVKLVDSGLASIIKRAVEDDL